MYTEMTYLLEILDTDIKKHGNQPLTTLLLKSFIIKAQNRRAEDEERINETFDPMWD